MASTGRKIAVLESHPRLTSRVILRRDDVRSQWVALAPESVIVLDERSLDVLRLCDGQRTIDGLAGELAKTYDAPRDVIAQDVLSFIQEWSDKRLVRL